MIPAHAHAATTVKALLAPAIKPSTKPLNDSLVSFLNAAHIIADTIAPKAALIGVYPAVNKYITTIIGIKS